MYTIQFGTRAHFIDDGAAEAVLSAIREGERFVTVPIDLAADGGAHYVVTLNVAHVVAVIKHREFDSRRETPDQERVPVRLMAVQ